MTSDARDRSDRRRRNIAAGWKHDDRFERMRVLQETDPERFDEIYGAKGALQLGLYESGKAAAGDGPDEAA